MNKIVVVIPTLLSRASLLLRSVDSVLSQQRLADHIVISCDADDVETKTFANLCKERFSGANIQIVANHGSKGVSGNINNAINNLIKFDSRETIVSLLDDDDYWMPDYLYHIEKKFQNGVTFVAAAFEYVNEHRASQRYPPRKIEQDLFLVGNPGISNSTMSIRLDTLQQIGGWNARLASCTDRDTCLRLLDAKAIYGTANDAVACIDRKHGGERLTDKGGQAKFSGLKEFYRVWRPLMSSQVYAASCERSIKLFGYAPGMPDSNLGLDGPSACAPPKRLVVAVTALDEELLNRLLMSFENEVTQKFQITFIVFRNNPDLEWNNHASTSFEVLYFQNPSADSILKIAEARNFLQMKVREYIQQHGKDAIVWFLDEDFTVDTVALEKLAEIPNVGLSSVDAIIGKYDGDSPNATFSGLLFELSDLYENLCWLDAQPDSAALPDRSTQNDTLQAANPETYNYALSHNAKPAPGDTAWLEPSFHGETIAAARERLLKSLSFIKQGISLFRPLRSRSSSKSLVLAAPTLHRGGNAIIINHRMLDVPFPEILYENGSIRRSDMMWAILASHHGGFKIRGSNLYAKHQRCETVQNELAIEKTQDELIGSIVFNSLVQYYAPMNQYTFEELLKQRAKTTLTMLGGYIFALDYALQRLDSLEIAEVSILTTELRHTLTTTYQEKLMHNIEKLARTDVAADIKGQFDAFAKQFPAIQNACDVVVDKTKFKFSTHFGNSIYLLTYGDLSTSKRPLIRLHSSCLFSEVFGATDCDCASQLHAAQQKIISHGCGAILYLDQEGRGHGLDQKIRIVRQMQENNLDTYQACSALGLDDDIRSYHDAKKLLIDLGIRKFRLLTNNPSKMGIFPASEFDVDMSRLRGVITRENKTYLSSKEHKCHSGLLISKAELNAIRHNTSSPIQFESTNGPYGELSNFANFPVFGNGVIWPTAEHYYQAEKFESDIIREKIRRAATPIKAKEIARKFTDNINHEWGDLCLTVMYSTVMLKVRQNPEIHDLLTGTKDSEIVEISKDDVFWGRTTEGRGANYLGKILMLIRNEITQDDTLCVD